MTDTSGMLTNGILSNRLLCPVTINPIQTAALTNTGMLEFEFVLTTVGTNENGQTFLDEDLRRPEVYNYVINQALDCDHLLGFKEVCGEIVDAWYCPETPRFPACIRCKGVIFAYLGGHFQQVAELLQLGAGKWAAVSMEAVPRPLRSVMGTKKVIVHNPLFFGAGLVRRPGNKFSQVEDIGGKSIPQYFQPTDRTEDKRMVATVRQQQNTEPFIPACAPAVAYRSIRRMDDYYGVKILTAAEVPDHSSGTMLALCPDEGMTILLSSLVGGPGAIKPEDLHCTLLYLGNDVTPDQVQILEKVAKSVASSFPKIPARISGVGRFTASESSDGMDVLVALVDSPLLGKLHHHLKHMAEMMGINCPSVHGFTPHITLQYLDSDAVTPIARIGPYNTVFNELWLVAGQQYDNYPFLSPIIRGDSTMSVK